jgi:hypothetical protein
MVRFRTKCFTSPTPTSRLFRSATLCNEASGRLRDPCAPAETGNEESDMGAPTPFCARIQSRRGDTLGDS